MSNITVEICYIFEEKPILLEQVIMVGTTIADVLAQQGFEIQTLIGRVGLFGKQKPLDTLLKAGDRIEIYDPLLLDPKEARRLRALASKVPAKCKKSPQPKA